MNLQEAKYTELTYQYYDYKVYKGYIFNGMRHGDGKYFDKYGKLLYDGEWRYGKLHGNGTFYNYAIENVYEGEFYEGLKHGYGKSFKLEKTNNPSVYNKVLIYTGEWANGQCNGEGKLYRNGKEFNGTFINGFFKSGTISDAKTGRIIRQVQYCGCLLS